MNKTAVIIILVIVTLISMALFALFFALPLKHTNQIPGVVLKLTIDNASYAISSIEQLSGGAPDCKLKPIDENTALTIQVKDETKTVLYSCTQDTVSVIISESFGLDGQMDGSVDYTTNPTTDFYIPLFITAQKLTLLNKSGTLFDKNMSDIVTLTSYTDTNTCGNTQCEFYETLPSCFSDCIGAVGW